MADLTSEQILFRNSILLFTQTAFLGVSHFLQHELIAIIGILSLAVFAVIGIRIFLRYREKKVLYTTFTIIPPRENAQPTILTEHLFALIHGLMKSHAGWFHPRIYVTCSLKASPQIGIMYMVRVPEQLAASMKKSFLSFLPSLEIREVHSNETPEKKTHYRLSHAWQLPINTMTDATYGDPIAYLTGALTQLHSDEQVHIDLTLSPASERTSHTILVKLSKNPLLIRTYAHKKENGIGTLFFSILRLPLLLADNGVATTATIPLSAHEQVLLAQMHEKLRHPLFKTCMTITIKTLDLHRKKSLSSSINGWMSLFANPYQSLVKERIAPPFLQKKTILSSRELASIWHMPYTPLTKTEDMPVSYAPTLPLPHARKHEKILTPFATIHGENTSYPISLTTAERLRHVYIIGATGSGKSTLLSHLITGNMQAGEGLAVIDPHGDLAEDLLSFVPKNRMKDVIYVNPDDIAYPIGINILELPKNLSEEELLREKEFITESVISLFHKVFPDRFSGPRMEYILRNTIHTAFTTEHPTLFTVYHLLLNNRYRQTIVNMLTDQNLKEFWEYEFHRAGGFQKVKMISPITNKIGRYLFSEPARRMLEQETSTIDFDDIIASGKILIANLSKGKLGEDTSEVIGILLMTKLQLALLRRARMKQEDRRNFYLYVDEFQNFATPSFGELLSEGRKYHVSVTLAHQTTAQITDPNLLHIVLANVGTVICFRSASPLDGAALESVFAPYVDRHMIASLPTFQFYMRVMALSPSEPFSGTVLPPLSPIDITRADAVIQLSREKYTKKYHALETEIKIQEMTRQVPKVELDMTQKRAMAEQYVSGRNVTDRVTKMKKKRG